MFLYFLVPSNLFFFLYARLTSNEITTHRNLNLNVLSKHMSRHTCFYIVFIIGC